MNGLRITLAAGVAAALACTFVDVAVAHADEETGLAVGVRVAYAIPFGDAQTTTNNNTSVTTSMYNLDRGMLPVWFDLGYRFTPSLYLGLFYQYAVTFPASNACYSYLPTPAGQTTCDGFDQRFGVDLQYHLRPHEFIDPWIGVGLGWETTQLNLATGAGADQSGFQAWGPQVDLQLGADLRMSHRIPVGPFVDFSLSEFNTENAYDGNHNGSSIAFNGTVHGWVTLGIRAQFNL